MKSRTRGVVIYNEFAAASQSPRSCSCCCTFQQTLGSCHFVLSLSLSLSQSTSLLLLLSLCVRLMSNFNLACNAGGREGGSEGAIPNGKQCKAVFSLLAHFESHVRVHFPRLVFHLSVDTLPQTHTHTDTHASATYQGSATLISLFTFSTK